MKNLSGSEPNGSFGPLEVGTRSIKRIALLTNPLAGKGAAVHAAQRARDRFSQLGIDVVSLQGASAASSLQLAEAAVKDERLDALVVCGGDGLINLALQAQAQTDMPLGLIPAGTGNDRPCAGISHSHGPRKGCGRGGSGLFHHHGSGPYH